MKRIFSPSLVLLGVLLSIVPMSPVWGGEEQDLIEVLQSAAGVPEKCAACQRLRVVGTAESIPALAALLSQERVSHAARYALEAMPGAAAGTALREALSRTSGLGKAGLIDSLGWRGEPESVPVLIPLLSAEDEVMAASAAAALGRIGGPNSVRALEAARHQGRAAVKGAVLEALLACAERLLSAGENQSAARLYAELAESDSPWPIQVAAWRGLVKSDPERRVERMMKALTGAEPERQRDALQLVRELNDPKVIQAGRGQWAALPALAQLAILDAQLVSGSEALATVGMASQSPHLEVRVAAWAALGTLNDPASLGALAWAAARGTPEERAAARESLQRVHGPAIDQAFLSQLPKAEALVQAELLRALGQRGETNLADVFLSYAQSDAQPVRMAALDCLRNLALPGTLEPLLKLVAAANSEGDRQALVRTLQTVCQASGDREAASSLVIAAMDDISGATHRVMLPLLVDLGTSRALEAALAATRDADPETVKETIRVLSRWPNAAAGPRLLELAQTSRDATVQTLALRGFIDVAAKEPDPARRLALLTQAMATARRAEEKKQALSQIGQIPTPAALKVAVQALGNGELAAEAGLAAAGIAEKLAPEDPKLAANTAEEILAHCQDADLVKRAWALRKQPVSPGPFIQDWVVCGPYRQNGVVGALAVFEIPFGPEKQGEDVAWRSVPPGEQVNLAALFPGQDNCVAYLKAHVMAPADQEALLLIGTDDGVKAWLNGKVVHGNNVDRPEVADEDMAPIQLKRGDNELMLKVTQGGGGWSARARIVGSDGKPIAALRAEAAAAPAVAAAPPPQTPPSPKPATLPERDTYKTLRLSDQFYAEGAYYGDFDRDGQLDLVAGPFWFPGPAFNTRHEYRPAQTFDPKGYSDNFLTFTGDFNGDSWTDILCVPFPGQEGFWYENPAGKEGHWTRHLAYPVVGNESPMWGDVTGDGQPELIFCNDGYLGYAGPNPAHPDQPWVFHPISPKNERYQRFTHGVGWGDLNGDQRVDLVEAAGWWEQPADAKPGQPWVFHPYRFADAGAQMLVNDVDGDGHADIITAWHCHLYGLVWWKQIAQANTAPEWEQHVILSPTPNLASTDFRPSQLHALELIDLNGDGLKDILTGKRFWAHGPTGDKEPDAPAVVFWLELRRASQAGPEFVPHLIDDDSGVGTQVAATDLNGDSRPDVIVGNKKGIFVHLSQGNKQEPAEE